MEQHFESIPLALDEALVWLGTKQKIHLRKLFQLCKSPRQGHLEFLTTLCSYAKLICCRCIKIEENLKYKIKMSAPAKNMSGLIFLKIYDIQPGKTFSGEGFMTEKRYTYVYFLVFILISPPGVSFNI